MKHNRNSFRNRHYSEDNWRYEVPDYSVIDLDTGRVSACNSEHQICAIAFGENKKIHRMRYLACLRTRDCFICM